MLFNKNVFAFVLLFFSKVKKDIIFALELGMRVLGMFVFCMFLGYQCDLILKSRPICLLLGVIVAFGYVMRLLLGAGKHE